MDIEKLYQQKLIESGQVSDLLNDDQNLILGMGAVSYTHLTLPTIYSV